MMVPLGECPQATRSGLLALAAVCAALLPFHLSAQWSTGSGGAIYYNGGNVGIGTATPLYKFDIKGQWSSLVWEDPLGTPTAGGLWRMGTGGPSNLWGMQMNTAAAGDFSTALQPITIVNTGYVGIGTSNPQHLLHVAGTIGATEVIVSSTGADYVFNRGYRLKPLGEVARYIEANHRLPDMPSAEEVKRKGMGVGEMEAKLLAKVEKLTLHLIQEEKENQDLRERVTRQEEQNQKLYNRLKRLETRANNGAVAAQ